MADDNNKLERNNNMIFYPDKYFDNVKEITYEFLEKHKIQGIILDVDNTLINYNRQLLDGVLEWCCNLKQNGIKFYIVSNSNKKDKIKEVAEQLGVSYILFAKKPFKTAFILACREMNLLPQNVAAVGDQIFTDVIGARRSKIYSILVKPLDTKDLWFVKIKRPIENFIIKRYRKKEES